MQTSIHTTYTKSVFSPAGLGYIQKRPACTGRFLDYDTLLFEGANGLGADLHFDFFAVYDECLGLKVWLPDFLGVTLRKADVTAKLLALASDFTLLHG